MVIGITGGIGSGKSTVSNYLMSKGFTVIDADKVARETVQKGSIVLQNLKEAFGAEILEADGSLNRKKLGEKAFSSGENKQLLDSITHTAICNKIRETIGKSEEKIVFVDAALLFEANLDKDMSRVWLVTAEDSLRVNRVVERDNVSKEDVCMRIKAQMSEEEKGKRADEIIDNSKNKEELYQNIDRLLLKYV